MRKAEVAALESLSSMLTMDDLANPRTKEMFYWVIVSGQLHEFCKLEIQKRTPIPGGGAVVWDDAKSPYVTIPSYLYQQMEKEVDRVNCKIIKYQIDDLYDQLVKCMTARDQLRRLMEALEPPKKSTNRKAAVKRKVKPVQIKLVTCPVCKNEEFHVVTNDMDDRCNVCKLMRTTLAVDERPEDTKKNCIVYDRNTNSYVQLSKRSGVVQTIPREDVDNMCNMW